MIVESLLLTHWGWEKWPTFRRRHFRSVFFNVNIWISIAISLKFVPGGQIDDILTLVQIMVWRPPGDKSLSGPMMTSILTHICVTRPQWVCLGLNMLIYTYIRKCGHLVCIFVLSWWRHQMETFSAFLALCEGNSPVTDEFPSQRPVTRSFDIFFDLRLNKQLSKQSKRRWWEPPSRSSIRHCNDI